MNIPSGKPSLVRKKIIDALNRIGLVTFWWVKNVDTWEANCFLQGWSNGGWHMGRGIREKWNAARLAYQKWCHRRSLSSGYKVWLEHPHSFFHGSLGFSTKALQIWNSTWVMMNQQTRRLSKMPEVVRAEISPWFIENKAFEEEIPEKIYKLDTNAKFTNSNLKVI